MLPADPTYIPALLCNIALVADVEAVDELVNCSKVFNCIDILSHCVFVFLLKPLIFLKNLFVKKKHKNFKLLCF